MDSVHALAEAALALPPSQWCQLFYLLSAGLIIAIQSLPKNARSALMNYGARRPQDQQKPVDSQGALCGLVTKLTDFGQVPHSWFLHFYVVSVSLSAVWAWQCVQKGGLLKAIAQLQVNHAGGPSMGLGQVYMAWALMALQGSRRLYESLYVSKPGSSPMWVVHWALGIAFYIAMSLSVWVEGSSAILESWQSSDQGRLLTKKMPLAIALYFLACLKQNECHRYLASLKKYTLPDEGLFRFLICPHYFFECLLYLAISWGSAPPGRLFNTTVLLGLVFVAVNLGATAAGTKKWYADKFGADKVAARWIMIPFVF